VYNIRCSKCNTKYSGSSFDAIVEKNKLHKAGVFYYCDGCISVKTTIKAMIKTKEIEKKKLNKERIEKSS